MIENHQFDESDKSENDDPMKDIRRKWKAAEEYWSDERERMVDDTKFRALDQWPAGIRQKRERDGRACLTVDKINQYIRQIVNDGRQNRPSIKVRPVDGGADVATAEVFQGLIRHIEDSSNADAAYDTALDSAAGVGVGYFRVTTEYAGDETFDQNICIRRVRNPLSVIIDPATTESDRSDMKFAFEIDSMSKEEFEEKYPGKTPDDWETNSEYAPWYGDMVRVARYWCVEEEDRTLYLMADGSVISKARFDELKDSGVEVESQVVDQRNIPIRKVKHCLVSGKEILEDFRDWPGKWIPILVVPGNELDVEGKVSLTGIIASAKDAQRLYNYSRSAYAERVALTPKAPWLAAEGQVEDYEDEWNTANTENHSVLRYRPTSLNGQPVPPPQRVSASDIPAGFAQDMQISEHDIQGAIGMYNASLGAPSNERSGKAITARQREGDVGTFHYHDNQNRAIRHCGRILIDLIPKIYDSTRVVRILGYDGTPSEATIDPTIGKASQSNGVSTIYNLGVGRYDVSITTGPSYTTLRQEAAESMTRVLEANPAMWQVIGDLAIKNMDWPGAQEISERLKLTLPPEIRQAEQAKEAKGMPPQMQAIMQQFEQAMQQKDQQMQQVMQALTQAENELIELRNEQETKRLEISTKATIEADKVEIDAYQAETQRIQALSQSMNPEQIQHLIVQTLQQLITPTEVGGGEMAHVAPQATEVQTLE